MSKRKQVRQNNGSKKRRCTHICQKLDCSNCYVYQPKCNVQNARDLPLFDCGQETEFPAEIDHGPQTLMQGQKHAHPPTVFQTRTRQDCSLALLLRLYHKVFSFKNSTLPLTLKKFLVQSIGKEKVQKANVSREWVSRRLTTFQFCSESGVSFSVPTIRKMIAVVQVPKLTTQVSTFTVSWTQERDSPSYFIDSRIFFF